MMEMFIPFGCTIDPHFPTIRNSVYGDYQLSEARSSHLPALLQTESDRILQLIEKYYTSPDTTEAIPPENETTDTVSSIARRFDDLEERLLLQSMGFSSNSTSD